MTKKKSRILSIILIVLTVWTFFGGLLGLYFQGVDNGDYATFTDWLLWALITAVIGYGAYYFRKKSRQ